MTQWLIYTDVTQTWQPTSNWHTETINTDCLHRVAVMVLTEVSVGLNNQI